MKKSKKSRAGSETHHDWWLEVRTGVGGPWSSKVLGYGNGAEMVVAMVAVGRRKTSKNKK